MAKKSILYVITKSVWGGAGKYVYDLSTSLPKDKFVVLVAAGGRGVLAQRIVEAKIPYFEIKYFQRDINLFKEPLAGLEILRLLFKIKPDIVHTNSSKAGGVVGLAAKIYKILSRKECKTIFTAHGWAFAEDRPKREIFLIKLLSKITALFYDKIICVSEYDKKIASDNHIASNKKLIVIHNGIDTNNFRLLNREEAQNKLLSKSSPLVIGTIAEWHSNKGLFYLLDAIKNLQKQDVVFDTVLIGSGENRDKVKLINYLENNKLDNIYIHKWVANAASYMKAFDIFILPSVKEGLPYTVLEAMAAEIPVIATTVGGIPEIIENGINGILIPSKNSRILINKIKYLLHHREIRQSIGHKAKERIRESFDFSQMIKKTEAAYILGNPLLKKGRA